MKNFANKIKNQNQNNSFIIPTELIINEKKESEKKKKILKFQNQSQKNLMYKNKPFQVCPQQLQTNQPHNSINFQPLQPM